jgi:hypothetical protein
MWTALIRGFFSVEEVYVCGVEVEKKLRILLN